MLIVVAIVAIIVAFYLLIWLLQRTISEPQEAIILLAPAGRWGCDRFATS